MNRLQDKVAIVTGAGSGVGRATAQLYAEEGGRVIVCDIREEDGLETTRLIRDAGGEAFFVRADVSKSADVAAVVAAAELEFGALHIMTANAGILGAASGKSILDVTEEEFWRVLNVNLGGVFLCFKHAVPAILRAGGGAMSSTGSLGGYRADPKLAAYGASKAGVAAFVRSLALELYPKIRVNDVAPGGTATNIVAHMVQEGAQPLSPNQSPSTVVLDPRDIARAHLYLVSEDSGQVTGQTIFVDAGRSITMN